MRKNIIVVSMVVMTLAVANITSNAQSTKKVENYFQLGIGPFTEFNELNNIGLVVNLSYGLDVRLSNSLSIMPSVGYRTMLEDIAHIGWVGGDPDLFSFVDIAIGPRYHIQGKKHETIFGLAPVYAITETAGSYYIDSDPTDPLDGKTKIKPYDIGLSPTVSFLLGKHWAVEAKGYISLINVRIQYPEYNETRTTHIGNLIFSAALRF